MNNLLASIIGPPDAAQPVEEAPEPAELVSCWLLSGTTPISDRLTAQSLRARCRGMVVSSGTVAFRSGIKPDRFRSILKEREPATAADLEQIERCLNRIQRERNALFRLAEENNLEIGAIL
jgi:hypothetical protein